MAAMSPIQIVCFWFSRGKILSADYKLTDPSPFAGDDGFYKTRYIKPEGINNGNFHKVYGEREKETNGVVSQICTFLYFGQ